MSRPRSVLRSVWDEIWSVFVDDGVYAGSIVVWLAVVWLVLPHLGLPAAPQAIIVFAGLAAILVLGSVRSARQRR